MSRTLLAAFAMAAIFYSHAELLNLAEPPPPATCWSPADLPRLPGIAELACPDGPIVAPAPRHASAIL